jgi:triacylglycerol esterase/lipase EstA (alpha/beta hydrolase family)
VSESQALIKLGVEELASAPQGLKAFHLSIARRAFDGVGPAARPVQLVHDTVAGAVYGGLAQATRFGGRALEAAIGRRYTQLLSETPRGAAGIAIINGLIGDTLEAGRNELTQPMALRIDGVPVGVEAFTRATPRLAVFLHGLMETEFSWGRAPNYGSRLAEESGWTPVYVRYNTGRRISENGRSLSDLLEGVVAEWPVDVDSIALIGHSMGGLVARSAAYQASEAEAAWVRRVRHVVSLGTPHRGAPLEEIVHLGSAALALVPETGGMSRFLRRRSGGIRDLRRGSLVDDDWKDRDPDALRATACKEIPLLEGATHCFVSASVTRSPSNPIGRLIGDMLVLGSSAAPWREEQAFHVGGVGHFALLNHPQVYERVREWLS